MDEEPQAGEGIPLSQENVATFKPAPGDAEPGDAEPGDAEPGEVGQDVGEPAEDKTLELSVDFPKRRISLHFGEQSVEVEGPDDMDSLVGLAERLWALVTPPGVVRFGFSAGSTLVTEIARDDGFPVPGPEERVGRGLPA